MTTHGAKPFKLIDADTLAALSGQLGVFEFADAQDCVIYIGRADARTPFGLRGEIAARAAAIPDARRFRLEVTTAYHTRHLELLMIHQAHHGLLPRHNEPMPGLGRLMPG